MNRIAIPVYKSRVSPVFDSCTRLLLIDLDRNQEIARTEILMEGLSGIERLKVLKKANVCTVICGGISDGLYKMISQAEIIMIIGIAGEVNQVMSAFRSNRLGEPCFYMPGYKNPQN
ncbi:MAG: NifB/NifX family molybdenum-iron cluster-binding protein [Desulfobacteraceae bacterium]|jgi:predicted Fe-Mo cluster-binding NifX family protein|nr:NifB/NifX family molybdenum-iron cluster-binding protein [Desulfobacteraceae bacterium]